MRNKSRKLSENSRLVSGDSKHAKEKGVIQLESILARREQSEIIKDMVDRSKKNFGK
jgi:hypothetical protein